MNGIQIERVLKLIDANVEVSKREALNYLQQHQDEIVVQLLSGHDAMIHTSAGDIILPLSIVEEATA